MTNYMLSNEKNGHVVKKSDYDKDILEKRNKLIISIEGIEADKLIEELQRGRKLFYFIEDVYGRNVVNFHIKS